MKNMLVATVLMAGVLSQGVKATDLPASTNGCLTIPEIKPGVPRGVPGSWIASGMRKIFETDEADMGVELVSDNDEGLFRDALPGNPSSYQKVLLRFIGKWRIEMNSVKCTVEPDKSAPLEFLATTPTGLQYLRGTGKVTIYRNSETNSVVLPCSKESDIMSQKNDK